MKIQTIECKERTVIKFVKALIVLIGLVVLLFLNFSSFDKTPIVSLIAVLLWPIWLFSLIVYIVGSPDLIITNRGIDVSILAKTYFIEWENVLLVREDTFQSWIYVRHLTLFNYLIGLGTFFLSPAIQVGRWRKNYRETMNLIKENIGHKFEGYDQIKPF